MSQLLAHERGFLMPGVYERLHGPRQVRVLFTLDSRPRGTADLFVFAGPWPDSRATLTLEVNGDDIHAIAPARSPVLWHGVRLPPGALTKGTNSVVLSAGPGGGWWLGFEPMSGVQEPIGAVSSNAGRDWRRSHMAAWDSLVGEYVVRLRADLGSPPESLDEREAAHELCGSHQLGGSQHERTLSPRRSGTWSQVLKIREAVCAAGEYRNSAEARWYAPWDSDVIPSLARGTAEARPWMVMCMHFSMLFVQACDDAGVPARPVVFTEGLGSFNGHFGAEVWLEDSSSWAYVDATLDCHFSDSSGPLSAFDVSMRRTELGALIRRGPGFSRRLEQSAIMPGWTSRLLDGGGKCLTHVGLWRHVPTARRGSQSGVDRLPPGHGANEYTELDIAWRRAERAAFPMFNQFLPDEVFRSLSREPRW